MIFYEFWMQRNNPTMPLCNGNEKGTEDIFLRMKLYTVILFFNFFYESITLIAPVVIYYL